MKRKRQKVPKQRNPYVAQARFRVAGAHDKPYKTKRAADKRFVEAFKRSWGKIDPDLDLGLDR
jgi:hypothetical protein